MRHLSIAANVCVIAFAGAVYAATPQLIDYQGFLKDNVGDPVADSSYSVTFTIYDDPSAGSSLWTETQSVSTMNGLFSIKLGAVNPIHDSVFADTMRYLGVMVNPDLEMTPRVRLVTVPYAYRAATVDGASGGELSSPVWWTEELSTFDDEPMMYLFNPSPAGPVERKIIMRSPTEPNFGLYYNTASESFQFKLGSSILTVAMTAGRVGVGTDNPASEMDIVGTIRAQGVEMGLNPTRSGTNSTVGGGSQNSATANWATVAGGLSNTASGEYSTVSGGNSNSAIHEATVAGGVTNTAGGITSFIGGGSSNETAEEFNVIGGGEANLTEASAASILGGGSNHIMVDGALGAIGGGGTNEVSGEAGTVPGGTNNTAGGKFAFAAGHRAKANHAGSFVWADSSEFDFETTNDEQFLIRASGGVGINTNTPQAELDVAGDLIVSGSVTVGGDIIGSTPWTPFPFNAGFEDYEPAHPGYNFQTVQYRKVGDIVYLRGFVHRYDHTGVNGIIGVLPVGFRPPATYTQNYFAYVFIDTAGSVLVNANGSDGASLDGFFFSTSP